MYFGKYRLRNRSLDKCLKIAFSEDPSTGDIVTKQKHC